MSTAEILNNISQQLNIYCGLFMFIFGLLGSIWNILIFRHYSFRTSSFCTYMLIGSIASLIEILFSLSDRIINEGFNIHWTSNNIAWCKIRTYIAHCASLVTLSCLVLSSIDRLFSTCRQIKWRRLNSVYFAKQICLFITIFWMLITMPILIYTNSIQVTSDKRLCTTSSFIWFPIVTLCCYGIFPWFFMSLFGFLTFRNLRRMRYRRVGPISLVVISRMARIDNQLTSILFVQIIICTISSIPYCIENFYVHFTQIMIKNEYRQAQDNLFHQIVYLAFYVNYISMFYVNYLSSRIFRQLSKQVLSNLCKTKGDVSREITMINHQDNDQQLEKGKSRIFTIH